MIRALSFADIEGLTKHDPYGDLDQLPVVIQLLVQNVPKFMECLKNPVEQKQYPSQNSTKIDAFGWQRFNILTLINSLLNLKYTAVNKALDKVDIFTVIVDLLFTFEHNSFCHGLVEKISMAMLGQFDTDLIESFIKKNKFTNANSGRREKI